MSGTAVPPGNCVTHGYHGRAYCPRCSTSALPSPPLGQAPTAATPSEWTAHYLREFVWDCRDAALEHQRAARRLLEIAQRVENPPEGVTVEFGGRGVVRFVGPPIEVDHAA